MLHINSQHALPSVALVGARGYAGLELARLLLRHPAVRLTECYTTREFNLARELMSRKAEHVICRTDEQVLKTEADIVFLATPAEVSFALGPKLVAQGKMVIDLSGAFRLRDLDATSWYGFSTKNLPTPLRTEYGLTPFCGGFNKTTQLIANPGCYATAVSLALIPLLKAGLIDPSTVVIDAKSGTTGAGRKASENLLHAEVDGGCQPYRVGRHQHMPEIEEAVAAFAGVAAFDPHMVTHLLPVKRGITAAIFARSLTTELAAITAAYENAYADYPLLRHGEGIESLASLARVVGKPETHVSYTLVGDKLYVFSLIDNLLKGAASQAVENLNRFLDLPIAFSLQQEG